MLAAYLSWTEANGRARQQNMTKEEQTANILRAMEMLAEKAGDVTPAIFGRYFERCADSKALMDHMDEHMLGRMMDQVLLLIMEPGEDELASYIEFETASHKSYGVQPYMYESLMRSVQDVIAGALADEFTEEMDQAFRGRIDYLLGEISAAEA
jgi:hypothetical protein